MVNEEAERWRRRYERERAARRSAEQLAADTMRRLHLQLEAERMGPSRSLQEQKAEFLNVVSHELRTPLTILRGGLHVLERQASPEPSFLQVLGTVSRASDRLIRIVQNVEISARLRDAGHQWGLSELEVRPLVRDVIEEIAPEHRVRYDDPDQARVLCSSDLLRSSIANLLQNAVTYGAPPIEIRVATQESTVEIRVIDHGGGLPADRHDLFRDFAQGDMGDQRMSRGLGLGLSIVVGSAVRGGWHVEHLRGPEDASTFLVRVPNAQTTRPDGVQVVDDQSDVEAARRAP